MSTPVFGYKSWLLAHVFYESLPSRWRNVFDLFSPEILNPLRPKNQKKKKLEKNIWREKKKKAIANDWVGVHITRVPNFTAYFKKTAWTLDAEQIWGDVLSVSQSDPINYLATRTQH